MTLHSIPVYYRMKGDPDMRPKCFPWLALISFFALGPITAAAQDRPLVIKWAHCLATNEPTHVAALGVAERVKESTGGRVVIQIFPTPQLGGSRDT